MSGVDWWRVETSLWVATVQCENGRIIAASPIVNRRYIGQSLWLLCRALTATASPLLDVGAGELDVQ